MKHAVNISGMDKFGFVGVVLELLGAIGAVITFIYDLKGKNDER